MTIYYVRPTNGSDAAAGTSFAAAWQTVQKAADTATAGDEVRLCNEASEAISATIDFDTNAGTDASLIKFIGADSTDGSVLTSGHFTIDGSGLGASTAGLTVTVDYVHFQRVRITGCTSHGINFASDTTDYWRFYDCRFDSNGGAGVQVRGQRHYFVGCEFDGNTTEGIRSSSVNRGQGVIIGCSIHDNTGDGVELDAESCVLAGNLIYDNGGDGINVKSGGSNSSIVFNTIFGNTSDGIAVDASASVCQIVGNSISGNGAYGILTNTDNDLALIDYNQTYNNIAASDITLPGQSEVTGDPSYTSTTDGSENFTPQSGSNLIDAGPSGTDIGALGPSAGGASGGGGPLIGGRLVK